MLLADFTEFFGCMIIFLMLLVSVAKWLFDKLDTKGEIKEAAKKKAVSKLLDWFK